MPHLPPPARDASGTARLHLQVTGAVQGVGFRPFVYRLASELGLTGSVLNDARGVFVEVEGPQASLEAFRRRLQEQPPPLARIHRIEAHWAEPSGSDAFRIVHSDEAGPLQAFVLPDVATCPNCLSEVLDPADRRHGYPFTNCTDCGPRFSIIGALPYDRPQTTMRGFVMCPRCRDEYEDPRDRRFHAQPNACPDCGPQLVIAGQAEAADPPLEAALAALRAGRIVGLKGLGGFLLLVDASDDAAVARLRRRKRRPSKPLALMVRDLDAAREICLVDATEARLLGGPESPIVLLQRRADAALSALLAPGNPRVGVMLPTTPLHHLIARGFDRPLVATSGNLSDEPICTDNVEAGERLGAIADCFLAHDRPIARHVDDSVAWTIDGAPQILRRARGLAPMPVLLAEPVPDLLGVGAHLKNAVSLSNQDRVFVSQHIGDMETPEALGAFRRVIADFMQLYRAEPSAIAHDLHPDYAATRWAIEASDGAADTPAALVGLPLVPVQHHHAHLASCLAEHHEEGPALGVIWDGTGLGTDGTIWGGEFLLGDTGGYRRVARLRPFALPGGDAAARDPRRPALALLHALGLAEEGTLAGLHSLRQQLGADLPLLRRMLDRDVNAPRTSSAGRLFDAVAAITGLADAVTYEGEAAMRLEFAAASGAGRDYRFELRSAPAPQAPAAARCGERVDGDLIELDWAPLLAAIIDDVGAGIPVEEIAAGFHSALLDAIVRVARRIGVGRVALSGGCFQNRRLQLGALERLPMEGFEVLIQRQVPPNDGGISLGQVVVAATRMQQAGAEAHGRENG